jgi:hypothetical protein
MFHTCGVADKYEDYIIEDCKRREETWILAFARGD